MRVKQIKDFEDYLICDNGKIFSTKTNVYLKPGKSANKDSKQEHLHVILCKNGVLYKKYVSRLVAETFIPNPDNKSVVHHKNDNPRVNEYWNLEWVTHSENTTFGIGVKTHKVLNGKIVATFESLKQAAASCGKTNHGNIGNCLAGKRKTAYGYEWIRG